MFVSLSIKFKQILYWFTISSLTYINNVLMRLKFGDRLPLGG